MRDAVLENAMKFRDAAEAEMRRWDEFIQLYKVASEGAPTGVEMVPVARPTRAWVVRSAIRAAVGAVNETEAAAIEILREEGRPIPTRDLYDRLVMRGVEIGGKEPLSTLSARLSRASRLENVRPYGWRIKERAADDVPEGDTSAALVVTQQPREAEAGGGT